MEKLRALWKRDPGLVVSGCAHMAALVFLVANFASPPDLSEQVESVPVEMITTSQLNQIMNGEKTAKQMPKPQRRVDKVAEAEDHKIAPPLAEAKKNTPPPPSPEKANDDPGDDDKPTEKAAAVPPPTPPERPAPPVPTPPARPVEAAEVAKPDPVKPPPDDAEAIDKKTPPKKIAKVIPPPPPKRPDTPHKLEPKRKETLDQVAKLLDELKPPKPVTKQRAGNEAKDAKHSDFSLDKITALLDHEAPQRKTSTGRQLTQLASLGSPTAHADKMSPSMMAQIDGWLIDHYRGCWSYFGLGATQDYVPRVRVRMAPDGSLMGEPALVNPPSDPNLRSLADSAIRAVNRCNPMDIPEWFKPHYDAWRDRTVRFDPKELS
jgi:colicin import membrane protein